MSDLFVSSENLLRFEYQISVTLIVDKFTKISINLQYYTRMFEYNISHITLFNKIKILI